MARRKLAQQWIALSRRLTSSRRQRLAVERQIIEESFLFDRHWYLQKYPDIAGAGVDPIDHYLTLGWREGRDPGPMFTTSAYVKAYEDVARSGVNPLVHFVQFGLAEGREGFGDGNFLFAETATPTGFGDPHPCFSRPKPPRPPSAWRRGYRLDRGDPRFAEVGGEGMGYVPEELGHSYIKGASDWLAFLSGFRSGGLPSESLPPRSTGLRLVDGWYVNNAQLRMRWETDHFPFVVRALQYDPLGEGEPQIIGEAAIESSLDFVDLNLLNPYFPILLVFADPDGDVRGVELLAFPSLCRGGMHYPELLWASARGAHAFLDVVSASRDLASKLVALVRGDAQAVVGRVEVDKADGDGNGALFRRDFRFWLKNVLRADVGTHPVEDAREGVGASSAPSEWILRNGGAVLRVPPDAAPTIASLVEARRSSDQPSGPRPVPLLAAHLDPSQPVLVIDVPACPPAVCGAIGRELPLLTATAEGTVPAIFPSAAIRSSNRHELSDAQLLVPTSEASAFPSEARPAMTWLILAEEWTPTDLEGAIQAAGLQRLANQDALVFVSPSATGALALARERFPGTASAFKRLAEAIRAVETPLIGYIGPGVLMHNAHTADCFASMLGSELVATASCVMVSAEKRSGVVKTAIVDGGAWIGRDGQPANVSDCGVVTAQVWRSSYPVVRPSPQLWAARSDLLGTSLQAGGMKLARGQIHLCTSSATATCLRKGARTWPISFPETPEAAAKMEWLVG